MSDDEELEQQYSPDQVEQIRIADLGNRIQEELAGSAVIKLILEKAEEAACAALSELVDVDASDAPKVLRLQSDVRRHRDILEWIEAAISAGDQANTELHE